MIYFPRGQSNPSINNATQSAIFSCFTKILLWLVPKHTVSVNQLKKKSPTILVTSANGTFYFPVFSASSPLSIYVFWSFFTGCNHSGDWHFNVAETQIFVRKFQL